ncbi:hypothetical protein [Parasphingorhabdus halotolerans]|uniref:Secreted protein n=1 Tax=Parasphingorhabdus halotolerans TaxID=2725558 RepID=A0A6H2DNQ3_9SPHN|nr:hypothetical protein [Parasphingorhabdus halotolerans]QJB70289.1 hypothetical protein HF685_14225 [Parasphingorhabdus halotolerans]
MNKISIVAVAATALSLTACEASVKEEGEMPSMDVEVSGDAGSLPEIDVETADIEVGTEEVTVDVPDVDVKMPSEQ